MTIYDLVMNAEIQGNVVINKITDDDVVTVYENDTGLTYNDKTEPYIDKEIVYIYAYGDKLVIEYREE